MTITSEQAKETGKKISVDWTKIDLEEFRQGLVVELEHGSVHPLTNITNDDLEMTGKIALVHLQEIPDYYSRMAQMKQQAARELAVKKQREAYVICNPGNINDFKVGDWVLKDNLLQYHRISSEEELEKLASSFVPIPLDNDLLELCGFAYMERLKVWQKKPAKPGVAPEMALDSEYAVLNESHYPVGIRLRYLHQLQNVYRLQKGQELSVKLQVVFDD